MEDEAIKAINESLARPWPWTLKLQHPIEFGKGRLVSELTFRRGKMGDIKGLKVDGVPTADQLMLIASRMCGETVALLEQLDADDGAEVMELALSFFAKCLGAGGTR
jgi:hypothetical protein